MEPLTFSEKAALIVRRTAQYGLTRSQESTQEFDRWLFIWSAEVVGEVGELFEAVAEKDEGKITEEIGDILWGITAICLLLEIKVSDVLEAEVLDEIFSMEDLIIDSLNLLDYCKKICRDGQDVRPIDTKRIQQWITYIFDYLDREFNVNAALDAVDAKLRSRYPNGFTGEASVNRVA